MIHVRYSRGLELPDLDLWLDPATSKPLAFVSHAHSDHTARHAVTIATPGTLQLMRTRIGGKGDVHALEFGERRDFGAFALTPLAAGHIFGSAQSFLETDAGSLLYTGDFKLRPGLSAEPAQWRQADTLIMETTYGLPKYRMPPTEHVLAEMIAFCREALDDGVVPVLLGYSLGKSQEILCALLRAGLAPMLHGAVWTMTEVYRELQPGFPTGYLRYAADDVAGRVLVCPPSANRTRMITSIKNRRVAVLTGWALDPGARFRHQVDAAFPLTDHADYTDLLRYVELVQPQRVLTLHGFAAAFASDLRARGIEAWALSEENQLELSLATSGSTVSRPANAPAPMVADTTSEFGLFAEAAQSIGATTSKFRKVELLAAYLRGLKSDALPLAAAYLSGRAFPQSDPRNLHVGWAIIRRALRTVSGLGEQEFRDISRAHADAGRTAFEALLGRTNPEPFALVESQRLFTALHLARGPIARREILERQLARLAPIEASYIVRVLTGDLRIGLKQALVEEAIAAAFAVELDEVREAQMLTGDLGAVATLAARRALHEATLQLFRPILCMLASPEPTAEAIWKRLTAGSAADAGPGYWAEDKYDGIRAQLHLGDGRVEIFSRDLRPMTEQFSDLAGSFRGFGRRAIFDGEILAFAPDRKLTFFDLQRRLGRKIGDDLFLGTNDVPVIFHAFDLLLLDDASLLKQPLAERRRALDTLTLPATIVPAPILPVRSAGEIEEAFREARQRGNEGLMIKHVASAYTPGRRGHAWLKFKKELATLDVVVVGAEQGHGKRSHVLSDYTFAVREPATGALLTIGKAYSGLTDAEIEELTAHFTATTIAQHGRYREVQPEIVLEIAFDSIQPSRRHASGLAMRFPRIKAIRRDKTLADIDTVDFARSLAGTSS